MLVDVGEQPLEYNCVWKRDLFEDQTVIFVVITDSGEYYMDNNFISVEEILNIPQESSS